MFRNNSNPSHFADTRGFTLVEILVALFVISVALLALISAETQANRNAAGLRDRTYAHWVAMNQLTELRLAADWPETGSSNGFTELARINWRWAIEVSNTEDPDLRRIEVVVSRLDAPEDTLVQLIGFRGKPQSRPVPLSNDAGEQ